MTGIVILNYNNVEDTLNCVSSVYKYSDREAFSLCVVDNRSRDDVVSAVREGLSKYDGFTEMVVGEEEPSRLPSLTYLINTKNAGYAQGNNCGLNYFRHFDEIDQYLVLNSDIILTEDILTPLTSYLTSHKDVGAVSPLLHDKEGGIDFNCARYEKKAYDIFMRALLIGRIGEIPFLKKRSDKNKILIEHPEYIGKEEVDIELPSGSCMLFKRRVFEDIGFFDSATFLYFEEDIIWAKLKKAGLRCVLLPKVSCIHLGAATIGSKPSKIITKSYQRSMVYFLENYSDFSSLFISFIKMNLEIGKIKYLIKK